MVLDEETLDRIYEAAIIPEMWIGVLDRISEMTDTNGGTLFAVNGNDVRFIASERIAPIMSVFVNDGWMQKNIRTSRLLPRNYEGFVGDLDIVTMSEWEDDPFYRDFLRPCGGGWGAGSVVRIPSGQLIVFNFERGAESGPISRSTLTALDYMRPHLARSALMSTLLGLERARSTANILGQLGLAAALIKSNGKLVAANALFNKLDEQFISQAYEYIALTNAPANQIFKRSLELVSSSIHLGVRSIAIPPERSSPAVVGHLIPITRSANDVFSGVSVVFVITPVIQTGNLSVDLLNGLFDLSPAEAELARLLLGGDSISSIAKIKGISRETLRSQLQSIFQKTGTNRQSLLVKMLSGLRLPVSR